MLKRVFRIFAAVVEHYVFYRVRRETVGIILIDFLLYSTRKPCGLFPGVTRKALVFIARYDNNNKPTRADDHKVCKESTHVLWKCL